MSTKTHNLFTYRMNQVESRNVQSSIDFLDQTIEYFLQHGSFNIRKSLFPDAHQCYWEQGMNFGFEEFYTQLDHDNRARFVQMVLSHNTNTDVENQIDE